MQISVFNLSKVYESDDFWKNYQVKWVDAKEIPGTNCYCDEEAEKVLRERIGQIDLKGIHFIDSGNYHYISLFFLERIEKPFRLLVFDNHTDMQPPAFGGLLSCGGWIAEALEKIELLQEVILIGPDEEAFLQVEEHLKKKVRFYSRELLSNMDSAGQIKLLKEISTEYPLYISIDKDVLCENDAKTTWSQGDMTILQLLKNMEALFEHFQKENGSILGIDICGEAEVNCEESNKKNNISNNKILELLKNWRMIE